ncbi:MAG: hypothetical protein ABI650_06925, partial [Dokdonella sp.]
ARARIVDQRLQTFGLATELALATGTGDAEGGGDREHADDDEHNQNFDEGEANNNEFRRSPPKNPSPVIIFLFDIPAPVRVSLHNNPRAAQSFSAQEIRATRRLFQPHPNASNSRNPTRVHVA